MFYSAPGLQIECLQRDGRRLRREEQCISCRDEGPSTVQWDEENEGKRRPGQGVVGQQADTKYHGECGYSGYTRGGEHQTGLQKKNRSNALW